MTDKKNLRRLKCTVTAQTLYHLERMAAAEKRKPAQREAGKAFVTSRDTGRVVDRLVREKVTEMRESCHGKKL